MSKTINISILFLCLFLVNISCKTDDNTINETIDKTNNDTNTVNLFEPNDSPLNIVNRVDTLKITISIADCGEFGGHKEYIYIQRNKKDSIYARFIMDSISCDYVLENYSTPGFYDKGRIIKLDTVKILNLQDEIQISKFIQRLTELYLQDGFYSNHGNYYEVINTGREYAPFQLHYWNSGNLKDTYYHRVRKLFIDK